MKNQIKFAHPNQDPLSLRWNFDEAEDCKELATALYDNAVVIHPRSTDTDAILRKYAKEKFSDYQETEDWNFHADYAERCLINRTGDIGFVVDRYMTTLPLVLPVQCGVELAQLWSEVRVSYAYLQHFGCCCAARGCIEFAVTEVCWRSGTMPHPSSIPNFFHEYPIRRRIDELTIKRENLRSTLHDAYSFGNDVIHNATIPTREKTLETMEICRSAINALYARFSDALSPLPEGL